MEKLISSFDGTKINYEISKSKNKDAFLVFLHGAGGNLTAWRRERGFFHKKGISTVAIDLRGHGKSGRPDLPYNYKLENFAKDVHTVIKHEKIKNFIIVGHCFGGMITIMFHSLYPSLAKSYVLIDTSYKAPKVLDIVKHHPMFIHILNHIAENEDLRNKHFKHVKYNKFIGAGDLDIKRIFEDIVHTSLKSWIFTFENIADFDGVEILRNMHKHVLVIEGEKDTIFKLLTAVKIHNLIKNSELDVIPKANHVLVINNPNIVEHEIYKFVSFYKGFGAK